MTAVLDAPGVALTANALIALRPVALAAQNSRALAALPGGFATRRKGRGLEVADTREYIPGDDMRHLDRGTTARTGRLHVRQFQEERDQITLLIADFRPSMFWGLRRALRSVALAEALALVGWSIVEQGGRVGLLLVSAQRTVSVKPRGRARGMLEVIGALVRAHSDAMNALLRGQVDDPPLDQLLLPAERLVPAGSEVVLASGFDEVGAGFADRISALALRRPPYLLHVTDAQPEDLPSGRYPVRLSDGRVIDVRLGGAASTDDQVQQNIAGRPTLMISAGDPVDVTARRLAFAWRKDHIA